ncbi:ergothioneine biosynthesis protein EgtB [Cytophagaceae bacterium ABcell3]|nr:ergothioneine biosynthesis protein EgtB [Cytophagaceae bacterium ABcell3]
MELLRTVESDVLLNRYKNIRQWTEKFCLPLHPEDMVAQPIMDVSPAKWHLGHTTWFFETFVLKKFVPNYRLFDRNFGYVFNSYYDSVGNRIDRGSRGLLVRPTTQRIYEYRDYVDRYMFDFLQKGDVAEEAYSFIELGLNHEQQHQELLVTDIKYVLGNNPLYPSYHAAEVVDQKPVPEGQPEYSAIADGIYEIGFVGDAFCYDNEKPLHKVYLNDFQVRNKLVTNGEYLAFIEDGGYADHRHWLTEGWAMVQQEKTVAPLYWLEQDGQWMEYSLSGLKPVQLDEPVSHVSFYEADAFARWAGKRLPSESEWEVAACKLKPDMDNANFFDSQLLHPMPATRGNTQLFGDVWEWTYSAYHPYPGYKKAEGALGEYNGKFMVNQMVLRGGSCATPSEHFRLTYRNFFHADKRWQFTGIRLAQ